MVKNRTIKPILSRIFQGLFFISFIWIYFSVIITNSGDMPWLSALLGIVFLALGIGAAYFCCKVAVKWKPKTIHFIFGGISVVILGLLFYFAFSLKAFYIWDINGVYRSAITSVTGNPNTAYLAMCPNNIFLYLMLTALYKVIFAMTGSISTIYAIILNVIFIYIAILFIYLIANKLWGTHIGLLTAIICFFFAPFYTYASQYYTDTLALPFVVVPIYLYLCAVTSKKTVIKYIYYCSAGIMLALGYKMKGSVAIILLAIILHLLLNKHILTFLKGTGAILVSFIIIFFSFHAAIKGRIFSPELQEATERPFTHYIMMGLKDDGGYDEEDTQFTGSFTSQAEKKAANMAEIKKRLSDFGFAGLINHLTNKTVHNTWGDGTYYLFGEGTTIPETKSSLWKIFTKKEGYETYFNIFYYYSQGFHLAVLTLLMISLGIGIKNGKIDGPLLFKLTLYGLFLFLLIWETRSRYIYSFTPLLLLISADTCSQLANINLTKIKETFSFKKRISQNNIIE